MSDVAEVKEALELLTEEGEFLKRISRHNAYEFAVAVADVCVAARRWVRVVEGLDYEAAGNVKVGQVIDAGRAELVLGMDVVQDIVDAAVGETDGLDPSATMGGNAPATRTRPGAGQPVKEVDNGRV